MASLDPRQKERLVVVVDSGGTKCRVLLASEDGIVARAVSGPCNYTTVGRENATKRIHETAVAAMRHLPARYGSGHESLPLPSDSLFTFEALTLGMAGLDRTSDIEKLGPDLAKLFSLDLADKLRFIIGNDATLLSVPMILDKDESSGIAVVSGTGSVAFSFTKNPAGLPVVHKRAGGYGSLLDDSGSGYHVGKQAIACALHAFDEDRDPFTPFQNSVYEHFSCADDHRLLLQRVYEQQSEVHPTLNSVARIASVCKETFHYAFVERDIQAGTIVESAAEALRDLIARLAKAPVQAESSTLVLGGSLFKSTDFQILLDAYLRDAGMHFSKVRVVRDAGEAAATVLAQEVLQ